MYRKPIHIVVKTMDELYDQIYDLEAQLINKKEQIRLLHLEIAHLKSEFDEWSESC